MRNVDSGIWQDRLQQLHRIFSASEHRLVSKQPIPGIAVALQGIESLKLRLSGRSLCSCAHGPLRMLNARRKASFQSSSFCIQSMGLCCLKIVVQSLLIRCCVGCQPFLILHIGTPSRVVSIGSCSGFVPSPITSGEGQLHGL